LPDPVVRAAFDHGRARLGLGHLRKGCGNSHAQYAQASDSFTKRRESPDRFVFQAGLCGFHKGEQHIAIGCLSLLEFVLA
jgi:hypothetical protein